MARSRKKIEEVPKNMTIEEASEFWDKHSFLDYDDVKEVQFEVDIQSEQNYFAVEKDLARKISKIAKAKGISSETLLNFWIKEKIAEFT